MTCSRKAAPKSKTKAAVSVQFVPGMRRLHLISQIRRKERPVGTQSSAVQRARECTGGVPCRSECRADSTRGHGSSTSVPNSWNPLSLSLSAAFSW
eukprot:3387465-Rhodomonas_salina.3